MAFSVMSSEPFDNSHYFNWHKQALYSQCNIEDSFVTTAADGKKITLSWPNSFTTYGFVSRIIKDNRDIPLVYTDNVPSPIGLRVKNIIDELYISKSFAAKLLNVSRTAIYDWIDGKTVAARIENSDKIEWLEEFADALPSEIKTNISLYRNRIIGTKEKTLEEVLMESNDNPKEVASQLIQSIKSIADRPAVGSWMKTKNLGLISGIYEAYMDNG